jgi:hypothetical protein
VPGESSFLFLPFLVLLEHGEDENNLCYPKPFALTGFD